MLLFRSSKSSTTFHISAATDWRPHVPLLQGRRRGQREGDVEREAVESEQSKGPRRLPAAQRPPDPLHEGRNSAHAGHRVGAA